MSDEFWEDVDPADVARDFIRALGAMDTIDCLRVYIRELEKIHDQLSTTPYREVGSCKPGAR
jgi:hypothetical protein